MKCFKLNNTAQCTEVADFSRHIRNNA